MFEELAGVRNAYAERAALEAGRQSQELAKQDGALEAIQRVVAMLNPPATQH